MSISDWRQEAGADWQWTGLSGNMGVGPSLPTRINLASPTLPLAVWALGLCPVTQLLSPPPAEGFILELSLNANVFLSCSARIIGTQQRSFIIVQRWNPCPTQTSIPIMIKSAIPVTHYAIQGLLIVPERAMLHRTLRCVHVRPYGGILHDITEEMAPYDS